MRKDEINKKTETPSCCATSDSLVKRTNHNHEHHHEKPKGFFKTFLSFMGLLTVHHDHDGHEHEHLFEPKKWILVVASIAGFLAFYHMIVGIFSQGPLIRLLDNDYTQLILGTLIFILIGIAFIKGSILTLLKKELSEDTLVAIASTSAFVYSVVVIFVNSTTGMNLPKFFYEEIEVLWLIYMGRFIEEWLTEKVSKEINSLNDLKPKTAIVIVDGVEKEIPSSEIKIGDIIVVKSGQLVPVDGVVVEGVTTIDESSLTGESLPINKEINSKVFGGTISSNGMIKIKSTKTLDDSFISQIIDSVSETMNTKPKTQRIADKIAKWLIPSVLIIAFVSFFTTALLISSGVFMVPNSFVQMANTSSAWIYAFYILMTILVIACPCSFGMTTPMSVLVASSTSKKESVLFTSNTLFESIKSVDVICFDKTGTLTEGEFEVIDHTIPNNLLSKFVSIEKTSNHPLANSITKHFDDVTITKVKSQDVIGKGLSSDEMMIGSLNWLKETIPTFKEDDSIAQKRKNGSVFIYAFNSNEVIGYVELKDKIKDTTLEAISQIRKMGIDVVMITGDHRDTAITVAGDLGIHPDNVYAEVSPKDKSNIISSLQDEGKVVAFVGDGINDSVALAKANIGIAIGEGSDAAIESADIVLGNNDLSLVSYSIWLSRRTLYTIKRGFVIAIIYNAVMIPMAATGILALTGAGPSIAAMSMVFNDSVAMLNAMTLKKETYKRFKRKHK